MEFPIEGLCLKPYVDSGDISNNNTDCSDENMYDLNGLVCHTGSMSFPQANRKLRNFNTFLTFFR